MMRKPAVLFIFFILFFLKPGFSEEALKKTPRYVGEFFGVKVPEKNHFFIKSALTVFGNRFGAPPKNAEEEEKCVWDQLLLSFEAFRRGIDVEQADVDAEVLKILQAGNVSFDKAKDSAAYEKWVNENTGEPARVLEEQIRHLLQIEKLRAQVMGSVNASVTIEEARQAFMDERSALGLEFVRFAEEKEAEKFYDSVKKNPRLWDEEKEKRPGDFKGMGAVSLVFLMDIWRIPRVAIDKMMRMKQGSVYPPIEVYGDYAVFKVLEQRSADRPDFSKAKAYYFAKVKRRKEYEGLNRWFEDLKKEADIKIYKEGMENE